MTVEVVVLSNARTGRKRVGESVLLRIGDEWLIVDSFRARRTTRPGGKGSKSAPMVYLKSVNVCPKKVRFVFLSHFHNDHYEGIDDVVAWADSAQFYPPVPPEQDYKRFMAFQVNKAPSDTLPTIHDVWNATTNAHLSNRITRPLPPRDQPIPFGSYSITVVAPTNDQRKALHGGAMDANQLCTVLRIAKHDHAFVLSGDQQGRWKVNLEEHRVSEPDAKPHGYVELPHHATAAALDRALFEHQVFGAGALCTFSPNPHLKTLGDQWDRPVSETIAKLLGEGHRVEAAMEHPIVGSSPTPQQIDYLGGYVINALSGQPLISTATVTLPSNQPVLNAPVGRWDGFYALSSKLVGDQWDTSTVSHLPNDDH
jgi:Metallo-beta-lactamase superfamily